jgi:predicted HAD superfamily Cof-like phosphohydrolase
MHKPQRQVEEFHRAFGVTIGESPAIRDAALRARLILEEAAEAAEALVGGRAAQALVDELKFNDEAKPDLVAAIDALCDIPYVTYGTAVAMGIDLEPFFDEVHRSNMAKIGGPVRADGKRLKPPGWRPPNIAGVLAACSGAAYGEEIGGIWRCSVCGEMPLPNTDARWRWTGVAWGHLHGEGQGGAYSPCFFFAARP